LTNPSPYSTLRRVMEKKDIAIRTLYAAIAAGTPAAVNAQTECQGGIRVEASNFIDMYPINGTGRPHIIDSTDPKVGAAEGFNVEIVNWPAKQKVLASTPIFPDPNGSVGRGEVRFQAPCNTQGPDGKPALEVGLRTSQDPENIVPKIIPNNQRLIHIVGREVKGEEAIKAAVRSYLTNSANKQEIENYFINLNRPLAIVPISAPVVNIQPEVSNTETHGKSGFTGLSDIIGQPEPNRSVDIIHWRLPEGIVIGATILGLLGLLRRGRRRDVIINNGATADVHNHDEHYAPIKHRHEINGTTGPAISTSETAEPATPVATRQRRPGLIRRVLDSGRNKARAEMDTMQRNAREAQQAPVKHLEDENKNLTHQNQNLATELSNERARSTELETKLAKALKVEEERARAEHATPDANVQVNIDNAGQPEVTPIARTVATEPSRVEIHQPGSRWGNKLRGFINRSIRR
jgi:hypothetical protein